MSDRLPTKYHTMALCAAIAEDLGLPLSILMGMGPGEPDAPAGCETPDATTTDGPALQADEDPQ